MKRFITPLLTNSKILVTENRSHEHRSRDLKTENPCICELLEKRSSALEGGSADIPVRSNVREPGGARKKQGEQS